MNTRRDCKEGRDRRRRRGSGGWTAGVVESPYGADDEGEWDEVGPRTWRPGI